ncbi:MAG TPA: glycosyltransferase family protein [Acidimicrobiales bacterium]|nr:glycosyltransferase family protein [Acidimicrobiales bacterium]
MSVLCVVQARAGSTRLPGKVLTDLAGRPMLRFMLDRLAGLAVDHLVVATSDTPADDPVAAVAGRAGVAVVRGSEHDVLSRYALALGAYPAELVVRLTGDCPLADPAIVHDAIALARTTGADYVSNSLVRTFPDGLDVEVLTADALRAANAESADPSEREHVTPFVYRRTSRFTLRALCNDQLLGDERWTVDTADDIARVREIVAALDDPVHAGWRDILAVAGRAYRPAPGAVHLRPVPHDDASTRAWVVEVDGADVGTVDLAVVDGVGAATISVDASRRAEVEASVRTALLADQQVTDLSFVGLSP